MFTEQFAHMPVTILAVLVAALALAWLLRPRLVSTTTFVGWRCLNCSHKRAMVPETACPACGTDRWQLEDRDGS